MICTATYETATLADALKAAAEYAPTKGDIAEKASGIVMTVDPKGTTLIRTCNLDVFYRHTIPHVSTDATEPFTWRLPRDLALAIIGRLPIAMGNQVVLTDTGDSFLYVKAGTSQARMKLMNPDLPFPQWEPFGLAEMSPVINLNETINQVRWATGKRGIFEGVHLTGEWIYATDGNIAAKAPLYCPLEAPVTAPLQYVSKSMTTYPEVYIGATDHKFILSTDEDIELQVFLLLGPFPNVDAVIDIPLAHEITFDREAMLKVLTRVQVIVDDKKYPLALMELDGQGIIRLTMDVPDVGTVIEQMPAESSVEPFQMHITPNVLASMVRSCKSTLVHFYYEDLKKPFRVEDRTGYVGIAMPRRT